MTEKTITNETIKQRISEYRKQREQLIANVQALDGAIQALDQLIKEENNGEQNSDKK